MLKENGKLSHIRDSVKEKADAIKNRLAEVSKKGKIIAGAVALVAIIFIALAIAISINAKRETYVPLYSSALSPSEASEIYVELQKMGANAKMGQTGEILVLQTEYDVWLLQMAQLGYPHSTLTYDVFSTNTGLTTTESEKEAWLLNQLQDRIQATLARINGVNSATVTITMPENTSYVWQQANQKSEATAGVLLSLGSGVSLSSEQIKGIKTLIASSVPKMKIENVTVMDAATGLALVEEEENPGLSDTQSLELEMQVQKRIEDNVERLLSARYGADGVVAVANVTLNYDAMMTETLTPTTKADGTGYTNEFQEDFTINGNTIPAGGIVGEENNTDIPGYVYTAPDVEGGATEYHKNLTYDYGYIKTQVEKGHVVLDRATISVLVNEANLTPQISQDLIQLVSNATDIAPEWIAVSSISSIAPVVEPIIGDTAATLPMWVFIALGVVVLLLILIIILLAARAKKRREMEEAAALAAAAAREGMSEGEIELENEIDSYKRQIAEDALSQTNAKESALVDEVREFARQNPEITANLLRSWMKEEE